MSVYIQANAAIVYAWIGEKDKAVDLMEPLMKVATAATSSVYAAREDIDMRPLRGFPRWEALLSRDESNRPFTY